MNFMENLPMNGSKTYVLAGAAGVVVVLGIMGFIDQSTVNFSLEFLGVGAVCTVRHGIEKSKNGE